MIAAVRNISSVVARTATRGMSTAAAVDLPLANPMKFHLLEDPQVTTAQTSKEELLLFHKQMYTIRRMEIACDTEYKARNIRGFCHLYDGQEAVAAGLQSGLAKEDHIISSYRCHGLQYIRGDSVMRIVAELFGFEQGSEKGKGGSMHLYSKKNRFWGGAGIVGAQVPVGVGLAFSEKYKAGKFPCNVSVSMYGDGAANQGQIWEVANMAKLWNLPAIFLCENNQYGMGTASNRSSCNTEYYKQGGVVIPGIQCDGMDVLSVREAVKVAKEHAGSGKGPIFLEVKTYRYHGHSMSDPGISYRDREEVNRMRQSRDCIEQVKNRLIEQGWSTAEELKDIERELRAQVQAEVDQAKKGNLPPAELLWQDVLVGGPGRFVRMPDYTKSLRFPA